MSRAGVRLPVVSPEETIARWIEAGNRGDIDVMLDCLHPEASIQPLSFGTNVGRFHGHDGLRHWLAGLEGTYHDYRIDLGGVRQVAGERHLATGSLRHCRHGRLAPFCGLYRFADGCIIDARHFLTEADVLGSLID